jgi:hypothetical protein
MPSIEGVDDNVPPKGYGVYGQSIRGSYGVGGFSNTGYGVIGDSRENYGIWGESVRSAGVFGASQDSTGVRGYSLNGLGVYGFSDRLSGVYGESESEFINHAGVYGRSNNGLGVRGESENSFGVTGTSGRSHGVFGTSGFGYGVLGTSGESYGVAGLSNKGSGVYGQSRTGLAALLEGNVRITGTLYKGGGSFRIDHPLDPANKYLSHSFVESPDMKNVYDGVVVLDDKGEAEIELPDWFGALNKDFRYQLTAIGAPAPNLYISEEIPDGVIIGYGGNTNSSSNGGCNNRFKIAGGTPNMKVSWHVTGIRKDPWANAHRISVEEDKPAKERGYYTYPELYGQPEEKGISHLLFPREEEKEEERKKQELPLLINDENKIT